MEHRKRERGGAGDAEIAGERQPEIVGGERKKQGERKKEKEAERLASPH